jgi:uncharacterized protein (TIGR00268 family)
MLQALSELPPTARHITAFSGGVDSSLTLKLVTMAFPETSLAVIGTSAALPSDQLQLARRVADHIGVDLMEVATSEGDVQGYLENKGQSCFHCKTALYSALSTVLDAKSYLSDVTTAQDGDELGVMLFNGTNKDDRVDPTRVGLIAASNYKVVSPLQDLTKEEVRMVSRELGLPNWQHAASPCLRSRLAFGVEATSEHMAKIERAESTVRQKLGLGVADNMRVRLLAGGRAVIELDYTEKTGGNYESWLAGVRERLQIEGVERQFLDELGFKTMEVRRFRSGGEAREIKLPDSMRGAAVG